MKIAKRNRWCCAVMLVCGTAANADTSVGNLTVVSHIDAACTVPSPNGNLNLPFQGLAPLTNQPTSYVVTITSSCTGGALISNLEFGDGLYATNDSSGNAGTAGDASHTHTRRMRGQNLTGDFLAYKIFGDAQATSELMTSVTGISDCTGVATGVCNNAIYFDGTTSTITATVVGKIYDATGSYASAQDINGDIYNDTVMLTLNYN